MVKRKPDMKEYVEYLDNTPLEKVGKFINKEETIKETLSPDAPASEYIDDFVHSDNKRFKGKSKAERIRMALGASYGNKRGVKEEILKNVIEQNAVEPLIGEDGKKKVKNQRFSKEIEK
jgi:hypothetical protein